MSPSLSPTNSRSSPSQQLSEITRRVNRIKRNKQTAECSIVNFPACKEYLDEKFPDVSISHIPIYVVAHQTMLTAGFQAVGGCYIPDLKLIIIDRYPTLGGTGGKTKFDRTINRKMSGAVTQEDIVVHEGLHAISDAAGRSTRYYEFDEEEFVYTNSVDFYRSKGMSEEEIINNIFLPFCVQDVLDSQNAMLSIINSIDREDTFNPRATATELNRFFGKYAEAISDLVMRNAREMGRHMVELYEKYGRKAILFCATPDSDHNTSMRFRSLLD